MCAKFETEPAPTHSRTSNLAAALNVHVHPNIQDSRLSHGYKTIEPDIHFNE